MFLSEPAETPFDLNFWLFGVHVRVHPFFWLVSIFLGWDVTQGPDKRMGLVYLGLWVVSVFVSILVHEFGHVVAGRIFGSHGHIVLYSFGGLAIGSTGLDRGWQRFLVCLAGPLAGFILYGIVELAWFLLLPKIPVEWRRPAAVALEMLVWINLFWGLINLLPIWPLDGGQMSREVFLALAPRNGAILSLGLSIAVAGVLAVHCLMVAYNPNYALAEYLPIGDTYTALLFGYLAFMGVMAFQAENARRQRYRDDEFPWER